MRIMDNTERRGRIGRGAIVLAIALGLAVEPAAVAAQDAGRALVLGQWEGRVTFGESARASLDFAESGGTLAWKYSYKYDPNLWGEAEGTVTSFSPPALELAGAWTKHAVPGAVRTKIRFSLKVEGDRMNGTVIAEMNNTPVTVSLARKK